MQSVIDSQNETVARLSAALVRLQAGDEATVDNLHAMGPDTAQDQACDKVISSLRSDLSHIQKTSEASSSIGSEKAVKALLTNMQQHIATELTDLAQQIAQDVEMMIIKKRVPPRIYRESQFSFGDFFRCN